MSKRTRKPKATKTPTKRAKSTPVAIVPVIEPSLFEYYRVPKDVSNIIFLKLDRQTVRITCRLVCKRWKKQVEDYEYLKKVTDDFLWERIAIWAYIDSYPTHGYMGIKDFIVEHGIAPKEGIHLDKYNRYAKGIGIKNTRWRGMKYTFKKELKYKRDRGDAELITEDHSKKEFARLIKEYVAYCISHKRYCSYIKSDYQLVDFLRHTNWSNEERKEFIDTYFKPIGNDIHWRPFCEECIANGYPIDSDSDSDLF